MKLGLEGISGLLAGLGEPHLDFPSVLVAGTNGKGSVVAFVSSILRAGGLDVGTFYSPHLFRVNERIRINGEEISSAALDEMLGLTRDFHKKIRFTFFEGLAAAACLYFSRRKVDMAVFEVGLGGRLDATRLVDAVITVITGISIDHREHLGATKHRILGEKLGIVRSGSPLVANLPTKALSEAARRYCRRSETAYHDVRSEVSADLRRSEPGRMVVDIRTPLRSYGGLESRMTGRFQVGNIATAVRAAEILSGRRSGARGRLSRRGSPKGKREAGDGLLGLTGGAVREGIANGFLAGRFQVLRGSPRVILDVSHNEEALLAALGTLRSFSPRGRNVLVFGVLEHKELGRFPRAALKSAREVILTPLKNRRSARAGVLLRLFQEARRNPALSGSSVGTARGMRSAIRRAKSSLGPDDTLLVLGSHMAVEEAAACL